MKTISRLLFVIILAGLITATSFAETAGEYVSNYMQAEFSELVDKARALNADNLSTNKVKWLRYKIAKVRLHIDVFSFAYPTIPTQNFARKYSNVPGIDQIDVLLAVRNKLDDGYDALGKYKDYYETVDSDLIPFEKRQKLNRKIIEWKESFFYGDEKDPLNSRVYQDFLTTTPENRIHFRPKKVLAKWIYRYTEYYPASYSTTNVNSILSSLCHSLTVTALKEYDVMMEKLTVLPLPSKEGNKIFHNYRKRIRTLYKIMKEMPGFYSIGLGTFGIMTKLRKMSALYGDVHDQMVGHKLSGKLGAGQSVLDKYVQKIQEGWTNIKVWHKKSKFIKSLKKLRDKYFRQ